MGLPVLTHPHAFVSLIGEHAQRMQETWDPANYRWGRGDWGRAFQSPSTWSNGLAVRHIWKAEARGISGDLEPKPGQGYRGWSCC